MSKTFLQLKTNIGNNIQDTSAAMATIIGVYINNRYMDILRRVNWEVVQEDYTIPTVAGDQDYDLVSNFGKELYCLDSTNNRYLKRKTLQEIADRHVENLTDEDAPTEYAILDKWVCGVRSKVLWLYKIPLTVYTLALPYIIAPTAMIVDGEIPMFDCDDIIEIGATADAWRYKRQFAKAQDLEMLYEKGIMNLIWDKTNQPNRVHLFNPSPYPRNTV
jgi:hypothetical protein